MGASDGPGVLNAIEELINTGQSAAQICDLLIENLRDLMVFQCAGPDSKVLVLTSDEKQKISAAAAGFDVPALIYNITALEKLRWTLKNSETSRPLLEALLLRLTLSEHFMSLANLSAQVGSAPATAAGLKKNAIANPAAAPAAPAAVPTPVAPTVQADIKSIQTAWPTLVSAFNEMEGGIAPFIIKARPVSFSNNTLEIQFDTGGAGTVAKNMCEKKADAIARIISTSVGTQLTVRFSQGDPAPTGGEAEDAKPAPKPEEVRIERSKILADPAVQMILTGLNATPSDIQKVEIELEEETEEPQVE
ncbi:MAG: hypothetical protein ACYTER_11550, partial [Planctomycetota bacterium]|jgi:DNA polymerase III gamma/tau subunit